MDAVSEEADLESALECMLDSACCVESYHYSQRVVLVAVIDENALSSHKKFEICCLSDGEFLFLYYLSHSYSI